MAVHHQLPPPLSVDTQDPQLHVLIGQAGGARGVHTQNLRGGSALRAAVSKGITVFCREEKQSNYLNKTVLRRSLQIKNTICNIDTEGFEYGLTTNSQFWRETSPLAPPP